MTLNNLEKKALTGLALLYASRMLGLFMIFPIIALYGQELTQASPANLGIVLGIYGVTQALLQIPFGLASDRVGRKPMILFGLALFLCGSVVCVFSSHVYWVIFGRALQGAGAISSVVLALLADYTRAENRSKAMSVIGIVIGSSFVVSVIIGPWLANMTGLSGVFVLTAILALFSIAVVFWLPEFPKVQVHSDRQFNQNLLKQALSYRNVSGLTLGIFLLHMTLTALFVGIPLDLVNRGLAPNGLATVYAPVMIVAFACMVPLMIQAEKRLWHLALMRLTTVCMMLSMLLLYSFPGLVVAILALVIFFVGFNFIEASLPSLLSRTVPSYMRGTAMGVFSTGQFLGAAAGGVLGGLLFEHYDMIGILALTLMAQIMWLGVTSFLESVKTSSAQKTERI